MTTELAPPAPIPWRRLHAFGLPAGSIRALLALAIFGVTWALMVRRTDLEVPDYLRDLLFIILGHYFAARNRPTATADAGPPPLFLPKGSVRLVLIAGFAVVAVILFREGRLVKVGENPGVVTLLLVGGFLLGVVSRAVGGWLGGSGRRLPRVVEDLRATFALVAAAVLVALVWNRYFPYLPDVRRPTFGKYGLEHGLAAFLGFYFGSRS